jgi:hypothetical protein
VRLGRAHASALREVAQHHRAWLVGQNVEQAKAHLDRLDARAQFLLADLSGFVIRGVEQIGGFGVGRDRAGAGK